MKATDEFARAPIKERTSETLWFFVERTDPARRYGEGGLVRLLSDRLRTIYHVQQIGDAPIAVHRLLARLETPE